jgi:phosphopantothenoylcysteine decarboxylase/phosphopantothenate--cysteine ligase
MGYAVAEAARDRGATAVIVAAPNELPPPVGVRVVAVVTAAEMQDAVATECRDADALIMAAAVADWRPAMATAQKLKKGTSDRLTIELARNSDILAGLKTDKLVKVGFAAESEDVLANARKKLAPKGLHLIAANDVTAEGSGFGTDTNEVVLLDRDGGMEELGLLSKYEVGHRILDRVAGLLA